MNDQIEVRVNRYGPSRNLTLRWRDPVTGDRKTKSAGTEDPKAAERLAGELEKALREGRYAPASKVTWEDFALRYWDERASRLPRRTGQAVATALNAVERVLKPKRLADITKPRLRAFQKALRDERKAETTIQTYLAYLRSALRWAMEEDLLPTLPEFPKRERSQKKGRLMRGRPITAEEFDRMLAIVPKVRPQDPGLWQRYLTGVWLSGLRLEESLALSWDTDAPFAVDLSGRHPRFRIYAEAEKGHRDRYLPMTPDFAEWLLTVPEDEREGPVFRVEGLYTGQPMTPKQVCRVVSKIGRTAGVLVNKAEDKHATAHDLRRSFGTRWAPKVKPATLQVLMRHASLSTTMAYYVALDADDVADELWAGHIGNNSGNNACTGVQEAGKGPEVGTIETPCHKTR